MSRVQEIEESCALSLLSNCAKYERGSTNTKTSYGTRNSRARSLQGNGTSRQRRRSKTINRVGRRRFDASRCDIVLGGLWGARRGDTESGERRVRSTERRSPASWLAVKEGWQVLVGTRR